MDKISTLIREIAVSIGGLKVNMICNKSLSSNLNKIFKKEYLIIQSLMLIFILPLTLILKSIYTYLACIPILFLLLNSCYIIIKIIKFYKNKRN